MFLINYSTGMKNILVFFLLGLCSVSSAQYTTGNAHSHNDYENIVPFWTAYNAHFGSIEADIFAVDGELYVAHGKREIKAERTLDKLYIEPVVLRFSQNSNKAWPDSDQKLQLLIDLKTPVDPTLNILIAKLSKYPQVFDRAVNPNAVQVVITGNMPAPVDFGKYPSFILFDGRPTQIYSPEQLERIALFSENLKNFTSWKGTKPLPDADRKKIEEIVKTVHQMGKKMRFWGNPDMPEGWSTLMQLGVDYINTDKINDLAKFLTK